MAEHDRGHRDGPRASFRSSATSGSARSSVLATVPASQIDALPGARVGPALPRSRPSGSIFQGIFLLVGPPRRPRLGEPPVPGAGAPIFYGLLLLATLGMLLVAIASDLIFLLLAIEVTSIATYLLVGYTRRDVPVDRGGDEILHHRGALDRALVLRGLAPVRGVRDDQPLRSSMPPARHGRITPSSSCSATAS